MKMYFWNFCMIFLLAIECSLVFSSESEQQSFWPSIDIDQFLPPGWRRRTTTMAPDIPEIDTSTETNDPRVGNVDIDKLVCVDDYEEAALKILDDNARVYYAEGSGEEITLRENRLAYKRLLIKPRVLVDVSNRKLNTKIFGKEISFPFGVSPTAFQKLATPEGEIANAKAAAAMGIIFTLSSYANTKLEDVARAVPNGRRWMQLYIFRNRSLTENIMQRAETNGYEAIVITIDSPLVGRHRQNLREPFFLPDNLTIANVDSKTGDVHESRGVGLYAIDQLIDPGLTWKDVRWVKSKTRLRVIVKGMLSPEDVDLAIQSGVDGILVSNHGDRQLDTVSATIDILPEMVKAVNGRCVILIDGGVRMGSNIFKALALGADMVLAGRPLLWGLTVNGEQGAKTILQIYKDEFNSTMALAGVQNVAQITTAFVGRSEAPQPR